MNIAEWPTEHAYVAKAHPKQGNGWAVEVFAFDADAPDQTRLVGTTATPTLARLEEKAWEFVHGIDDHPDVKIVSAPVIDEDLMVRVIKSWKAMKDAKEAEAAAAAQTRAVVRELRDQGLSLADIAFLTHVSRGRVSQLLI